MKTTTTMPTPPSATNHTTESNGHGDGFVLEAHSYELYEQRGRGHGFASDDWLQAEAEILEARKQPIAKKARASS